MIFSDNLRGYLSESWRALYSENTPRQKTELLSWSFSNAKTPTALWKKKFIFFSNITAISLILKNILDNLTLKTLSTRPRIRKPVSPSCQRCMVGMREWGCCQRPPAQPARCSGIARYSDHMGLGPTHHIRATGTHPAPSCPTLVPALAPFLAVALRILPQGQGGIEHFLFSKVLNRLESCFFPSSPRRWRTLLPRFQNTQTLKGDLGQPFLETQMLPAATSPWTLLDTHQ